MILFKDLVRKNRSYRRFDASKSVSSEDLTDIINTARLTPSAANLQPIRYWVTNKKEENDKVFSTLKWAGYLPEWDGPEEKEQPTAYIILLFDNAMKKFSFDEGIVAQTITLAAVEKGYGCCILQNCNSKRLFELLGIDADKYTFSSVIAIGIPVETVVIEEIKDGNVKYYRNKQGVHYVPKRTLDEIILHR